MMARPSFGRDLRDQQFLFGNGVVDLNHGSLGTYPRPVRERLRELQDMAEAAPDRFKLHDLPQLLHRSREAIAGYLRVPTEDIDFVESTTTAIDIVLRSIQFQPGDLIVFFETVHDHIEASIARAVETTPAGALELHLKYPVTDREVVQLFRSALIKHRGRVRIALFETATALPAARLPFESLVEVARQEGVLTFIDGAHGVGHLPLDVETLKPDFFVSDCHKWLFVPRPCTLFYAPQIHHQVLRNVSICRPSAASPRFPTPSSPGSGTLSPNPPSEARSDTAVLRKKLEKSEFDTQLESTGAMSNISCLCIPEALRFRRDVCGGEGEIMTYCSTLSQRMAARVASILFTSSMEGDFARSCFMFNVILPLKLVRDVKETQDEVLRQMITFMTPIPLEQASAVTKYLNKKLLDEHQVALAIFVYKDIWWARFSAQVYLQEEDFEYGARALKAICLEIREGKHLQ